MVNMKIDKGNRNIAMTGTIDEIVAEITYGIETIYKNIGEQSEDAADLFEAMMLAGMMFVFHKENAVEMLEKVREEFEEDTDVTDIEDLMDSIKAIVRNK